MDTPWRSISVSKGHCLICRPTEKAASEVSVSWGSRAWTGVTRRAHLQRTLEGTAGAG